MVWGRVAVNRALAAVILMVALPHIIVASRLHRAGARAVALRWTHRLARLTGVSVQVTGSPTRQPGLTVVVANHSSYADIVALLLADPEVRFVAGADLFRIPLLAGVMRSLETVPVDRRQGGGVHLVLPAGTDPDGLTLAVFPEGGIPGAGQRRAFRRGAFALAISQHATVVPVAIHGTSPLLAKGSRMGVRPGTAVVEYLPPIDTSAMKLQDRARLTLTAEAAVLGALGPPDGGHREPSAA